MKHIFWGILLVFISSACASMTLLGYDTTTTITQTNLKCLQNKNYLEETYIQLYNDATTIQMSVDYVLLKQINVVPHGIIFVGMDSLYPDWAISKWTQHFLTHDFKTLWISWEFGGGIQS